MGSGHLVAAAKRDAIGLAQLGRQVGASVFLAVVHVRAAMVSVILARAFDAVVETAALDIVELSGRNLPGFLAINQKGRSGSRFGSGTGGNKHKDHRHEGERGY
jgi:hypothetical protein